MESMMESPRFNQSGNCKEHLRLEMDSLSQNEEFARVVTAVFMSRLNPTLEEVDDVKTAVSEAVTNAVIHGYQGRGGVIHMEITADTQENVLEVCVKDTGVGIADKKSHGGQCLPRILRASVPAWDFPLWRHLWIRWMYSQNRVREPWYQ